MSTPWQRAGEWWAILTGDMRPKHRPRGFSDAGDFPLKPPREDAPADEVQEWAPYSNGEKPFANTGPVGHRSRMRERLLTRSADSLADYEMLEMLLFFAFKRGDTKPLAKALINRFGSFANVLSAPQQQLLDTPGLGPHAASAPSSWCRRPRCGWRRPR